MQKFTTLQPSGFWLMTGAAVLWGTIGIATQTIYNIDTTSSLFLNMARLLVAAPVMLVAGWRVVGQGMFNIRRRDLGIMVLAGLLLAMSQATYFAAIRYSGVTIATLLAICAAPLVVTGVSVLLKWEKLTQRTGVALLVALLGSVLLVGMDAPEGDQTLLGTLLAIVSAATYGSVVLCGRFLATDYHPLQVTAVTFSVGALALIVINLVNGVEVVQTAQGWLLVLYLGLVPTALAYWLFQSGLRSLSATSASIVSMLDPLVAALLAWVLFGETLGVSGVVGAGLLIASIILLSAKG